MVIRVDNEDLENALSLLKQRLEEEAAVADKGEETHREGVTGSEELDEAWAHYYCGKNAGLEEALRLINGLSDLQENTAVGENSNE